MLKPNSSINPNVHVGVFKGFVARALRLCSKTFLKEELEFLVEIFVENGHDRRQLEEVMDRYIQHHDRGKQLNNNKQNDKYLPMVKLPWMPLIGPRLKRIMKKHQIKTVWSSGANLSQLLCNNKNSLPTNSHPGVYELDCECGVKYIGETKKKVSTRINQHERDVFHGRWENSGASQHASTCENDFRWEGAKTIAVESEWGRRKVREALEIRREIRAEGATIVNRDNGNLPTTQWDPLIGKLVR